jgi:hypothetical protein
MSRPEAVSPMLGSMVMPPLGRPRKVLARLALSTLAVLWLGHAGSTALVNSLLPLFRAEVMALDDNLSIESLEQIEDGPNRAIRMRANLQRPIRRDDRVIYPLGWLPHTAGIYQVYLNTIGVLQAPAILLIVVLSWPHRSWNELLVRMAVTAPLLLVLLSLDSPAELLGNFRHAVLRPVNGFSVMFAWARFLEGGGNCALALAFAGSAIALAARGAGSRAAGRAKGATVP